MSGRLQRDQEMLFVKPNQHHMGGRLQNACFSDDQEVLKGTHTHTQKRVFFVYRHIFTKNNPLTTLLYSEIICGNIKV